MKQLNDQALATRILQAREDGGYKFIPYVRVNVKSYSVLIIYFAVLLTVLAFVGQWYVFALFLGLLLGTLLRDVGQFRGVNRTWPFFVKIMDWEAVKKLSEEKPSA